jgi:hypothetical protein
MLIAYFRCQSSSAPMAAPTAAESDRDEPLTCADRVARSILFRRGPHRRSVPRTVHWITVEVFDGEISAATWATAWRDRLVEAAVTGGACFWDDHGHRWGVVLEFTFADEQARDAFRDSPALRAALDGAPERVLVYPHRGGSDGMRQPRRPRPLLRNGGAELPAPDPDAERVLPCAPAGPPVEGLTVSW